MAASSRGRGRGRGLLQRDPPIVGQGGDSDAKTSKPAKPAQNVDGAAGDGGGGSGGNSLKDMEDMMSSLALDISDQDLTNIYQLAETSLKDDKDLKALAVMIYTKCMNDREFAKSGACICYKLSTLEAKGAKFRSALLSLVQNDFTVREEIRTNSKSKYLSFLTLMCQLYGTMKTASGETLRVLVGPLYDCLELIVNTQGADDDDELECLSLQLQTIGKELEGHDKARMTKLLEKIRTKIIRDGCSAQTRCTLLELVECYCRGWRQIPNDVTRFYCDTMADILAGMVI
ncbi:hypothetical protein ACJMK2_025580 [Sinanodonta woodiana]|uniref:MIF4G domain-containing protein n=1 Tax=Sinanodonta woodiana TaxID=1069815 RepID=A0ABD3XJC5_SINWO